MFSISGIANQQVVKAPERRPSEPIETAPPIILEEQQFHAIIEYGTPEIIKHNDEPLFTYIRYPQGGNPTDTEISQWANQFYNDRLAEFYSVLADEPGALGEINVHFDSFLIDNRYVGIFESGNYSYYLGMPAEIVLKAFNIDLSTNKFLENSEIIDFSYMEDILAPLLFNRFRGEHPRTETHLNFIDESWLDFIVIGQSGIIVVIERDTLLPNFDTLTVTLPYDDLGPALLLRNELPLETVPNPTPAPTLEPNRNNIGDDGEPLVNPQGRDIDPSRPVIALSFDDGPGIYTNQFLDLFEMYGIRATFCTIGNLVNTQTEALKRAVEMGCEVIGHSWDHKNLAKLPADAVRKQLIDTRDAIEAATGVVTPMFRPPYGEVNETMKDVAADLGFSLINWNVDPEDWNTHDPDDVYDSVMAQVKPNAIILSHEIYKSTLIAYQRLIPDLISQGYQIVTVSELLTLRQGELEPGRVYYNG